MYNDMISWQTWNVLVVHKIEHIYLKNGYEMWLEIYEGLIAHYENIVKLWKYTLAINGQS
jgi:hypothetical protein